MKAENRIGVFDIFVGSHDDLTYPEVHVYIAKSGAVEDRGHELTTIGSPASSFIEFESLIKQLKHDLDVLLTKSRQHFRSPPQSN
jgi:hypothetical protein